MILDDFVGWPLFEVESAAKQLGVNVKIVKEFKGKRIIYHSIKREPGDLLIEIEDGKVVFLKWHEK